MKRHIGSVIIVIIVVLLMIGTMLYMGLDTPIMLLFFWLVVLCISISNLVRGLRGVEANDDEIINSSKLHNEMNQELKQKGRRTLEPINNLGGVSTNNLARKDKSWSSVPDFFYKMMRNKTDRRQG